MVVDFKKNSKFYKSQTKYKKDKYLAVSAHFCSDICETLVWALSKFATILPQEGVHGAPPYYMKLRPDSCTFYAIMVRIFSFI